MKQLAVKPVMSDEAAEALAGTFLGEDSYTVLIDRDADVFRETDGTPLLHFRRRQIAENDAQRAFKILLKAAAEGGNRGTAAGKMSELGIKPGDKVGYQTVGAIHGETRFFPLKQDGTLSKRSFALQVPSSVVGALERSSPALPYCRLTSFTAKYRRELEAAGPFIRRVSAVFAENSPDRYAAQLEQCNRTHPDYIFKGTAFSTITVNRNWRTAIHTDNGDLRSGFGVLSVLSEGRYTGCLFVIPKYGVAVDMRHGDVLLADVHEYHGNTPLVGQSRYHTRLSCVFYFRRRIVACRGLEEEREIAKRRVDGQALFADFDGEFPV
jgi:hypothetical protein